MRRPTPFNLPWRIDGWMIDHSRWYRLRYYTPMPDLTDLSRAQAFLDTTAALGELSQKWGTIGVQEIARSWVDYLDRVREINARHGLDGTVQPALNDGSGSTP